MGGRAFLRVLDIMIKRPIIIGEKTSIIKLTKGYEAVVSNDKLHLVDKYNWHVLTCGHGTPYAMRWERREGGKRKAILMHRIILQCPDGFEVDHCDGNGLNNTNDNLRFATLSQNQRNRRVQKNNSTGVHGVTFDKSRGRYRARIQTDGKRINLGRFSTLSEAKNARILAKKMYHGEFGEV